jgi:hypothetical protein
MRNTSGASSAVGLAITTKGFGEVGDANIETIVPFARATTLGVFDPTTPVELPIVRTAAPLALALDAPTNRRPATQAEVARRLTKRRLSASRLQWRMRPGMPGGRWVVDISR